MRPPRLVPLQAALRLVALGALAVGAVAIASRSELRLQLDATRTRAYALGEQTRRLLAGLEGDWSITLVVADAATDAATRRQLDEVLRRLAEAGTGLRTRRIDPTDPLRLAEWEEFIESLQRDLTDPGRHASFRAAMDEAEAALQELRAYAANESAALAALPAANNEAIDRSLSALRTALVQLEADGPGFAAQVSALRTSTVDRPLADEEAARGLLLASHGRWSEALGEAAELWRGVGAAAAAPEALRRHARAVAEPTERLALRLRQAQDRLQREPAPATGQIARALASGEAAIVAGPPGATAVPAWQLFSGGSESGPLRGDRRFRGEQVLAAAIRSLLSPPPLVVVLHAEERSLLRPSDDGSDLAAAADTLRAARCEVREWLPTEPVAPRAEPGRPTVWLVAPPLARRGVELAPGERVLLERTRRLVEEGHPILLTVARSLRPVFRERDPWADLAAPFGLEVRTGTVLLELDRVGPGRGVTRSWQRLVVPAGGEAEHVVADAIAGQGLLLNHPTPVHPKESSEAEVAILASLEPSPQRWLEEDWRQEGRERPAAPEGRGLDAPMPVVVAAQRSLAPGSAGASQRLVLVASGGWLLTSVMDAGDPVGGGRSVLANPGNRELLLASVLWLAERDDDIAPGAARDTARLAGIDASVRRLWSAVAVAGLPLGALLAGLVAVAARRRA